ncbi:TPM domain-containing protein [Enterococcus hirae]|uniref:TPM domain-containing protein n=1 Tax=Enterococcus hirae TaxID=1354 RepID=UPI000F6E3D9C|nr:TPM domain-containing protein [Enterococcus hirae]MBA5270415.1 TPM domain-containing protein [Enterococcus hirae]MDU4895100.1 TPM domain-containing protein [Enterococcus hirae]NVM00379.1 TPM domain-containing protein [Enterococcus hirae]VEE77550.1 Beta-propeller domains of methanol dehydrogenase type [Enterococcus hirae]
MKKRILLFFIVLFGFFWSSSVDAATPAVNDEAGLFTQEQIQSLEQQIQPINEKIKGQIFIVTTTSNSDEPRTFADDYLRNAIGNDQNGAVLLLDMGQREIYISTSGNMIDYLDDTRINDTLDDVYDQMTNSAYFAAAQAYLTKTSEYVEAGVPGGHYQIDEETGKITRYKVLTTTEIVISIILALALSLVFYFVTVSRYQLKSGTYKYPFREKSNVKLTDKTDRLTNSFVTTRRIPKSPPPGSGGGGSTTHSSGGGTFGGGGRSF